ncbi:hypothetical protein QA612_10735 [Evansella sp. AB-P1]|uniref:hypothetical protein n=1 Tax=Evansella sp. AB-P1 TaxID=3037653 RepID=UPI00241E6C2E|nr:hypothetical protein [Evansella sp. AB-P1]MDG5787964.1 hypothetical protein [Evansella sp. AB-P1]
MKKIILVLSLAFIFTLVLSHNLLSTSAEMNPKTILSEAHDALLKGDIVTFANLVIDKRFNTKKEALYVYMSNEEDPLINYEILNFNQIDKNTYTSLVKSVYQSGIESEALLTLQFDKKEWKIVIPNTSNRNYEIQMENEVIINKVDKLIEDEFSINSFGFQLVYLEYFTTSLAKYKNF